MSTSNNKTRDNYAHELLDYVIYGDKTLSEINCPNATMLDISLDIKRCEESVSSMGSTLKFASPENVCEECEEEHGNLISTVEDAHSDLDCHLDTIVTSYQALLERNHHLENIIHDLVAMAVKAVDDDEVEQFEEKLILSKLTGDK
jgi:hypothetical protein